MELLNWGWNLWLLFFIGYGYWEWKTSGDRDWGWIAFLLAVDEFLKISRYITHNILALPPKIELPIILIRMSIDAVLVACFIAVATRMFMQSKNRQTSKFVLWLLTPRGMASVFGLMFIPDTLWMLYLLSN